MGLCVAGLMATLLGATAQADQPSQQLALGVSPALSEIALDPGRPKTAAILVTNVTKAPLPVKGTVARLTLMKEVADNARRIFDASSWFTLSEPEFILQPHQTKEITATITPPVKAEAGGHYATIFFQPLVPAETIKNNTAYIGSKVGVLALLVVKGDIKEKAVISDLHAPLLSRSGPITFELSLQNQGNVHFIPTGTLEIYDTRGKVREAIPLHPSLVLPKTTKKLSITWDNKQRLGRFTAKATVRYGTKQTTLTSPLVQFWILPWLWTTVITIVLLSGGYLIWRLKGRWRRALNALINKKAQ